MNHIETQDFEVFPTDIRYVNSYLNVTVSIEPIVLSINANQKRIVELGCPMEESFLLLSWALRRCLTEQPYRVFDFEMNTDYEDIYTSLLLEDGLVVSKTVRSILEERDFKPTMVQTIATKHLGLLMFGASDVYLLEKQAKHKT